MRKLLFKGTISEVIKIIKSLREDIFEVLEELYKWLNYG